MNFKITGFLLPLLIIATPVPQSSPDPGQFEVVNVASSGNGCPVGTVSNYQSDNIIKLDFANFQAAIGPDVKPADRSRNCQLSLNLKYPSGVQYTVKDATYGGYAALQKDVTGSLITTYYYSSGPDGAWSSRMTIPGSDTWSKGQFFTKQDQFDNAVIWSQCSGSAYLYINKRLTLTSTNASVASGMMAVTDGTVYLTQRSCAP